MKLSKFMSEQKKLIVVILTGLSVLLALYIFPISKDPPQKQAVEVNKDTSAPMQMFHYALPMRLLIPRTKIEADIEHLGLTALGAMDTPKGPQNVAWFQLGPRPGEIGSAVIAGHEGWKNNTRAVFDDLYKLQKGDEIYVRDKEGAEIIFVVREARIYNDTQDFSDVFRSSDGKAHLNLITCAGAWNPTTKIYPYRRVVFTDKK